MDHDPSITAVIPTFNRVALVVRAIDSALGQSRPPIEVVIVDDGSTDGTADVVRGRYGAAVRLVQQPNRGVAAARNAGVAAAGSDWVAFLDSDDMWRPEHLERMASAIVATRGAAVVYFADTQVVSPAGRPSFWEAGGFAPARPFEYAADGLPWASRSLQPHMLQAAVLRRAVVQSLGGFWEALSSREDTHLFFRLGLEGGACAVHDAGAMMTDDAGGTNPMRGGRLTSIHATTGERYWQDTVRLYRDLIRRAPPAPQATRQLFRQRLAVGYWRLGRRRLDERRPIAAAGHIARAISTAPRPMLRHVTRRH